MTTLAGIQQELIRNGQYDPKYYTLKPAWKFAFYNAAKKDETGSAIVKAVPVLEMMTVIVAWWTIVFSVTHQSYFPLIILPFAIAVAIYLIKTYHKRPFIRVNETGILFKEQMYQWQDFTAAYLIAGGRSKPLKCYLVLIKPDGYIFLNMGNINYPEKIGTAIRDFQPESWKNPV